MKIPFPPSKTLWALLVSPLLMAVPYLLVAYPRFCPNILWQHPFVLPETDSQESSNLANYFDPHFLGVIRIHALANLMSY